MHSDGTGYGYSLWSMEVFGGKSEQNPTKPGEETTKPQEPEISGTNVAVGKTVVQSGAEGDAMGADKAIDGNKGTRWSSNFNDDAWMYIDLEKETSLDKILITWENQSGSYII